VCPHGGGLLCSCRERVVIADLDQAILPDHSIQMELTHEHLPDDQGRLCTSQHSVVSWKTVIFRYLHVWHVVDKAKSRGSQSLVFELHLGGHHNKTFVFCLCYFLFLVIGCHVLFY
jgi:hypothetical protein